MMDYIKEKTVSYFLKYFIKKNYIKLYACTNKFTLNSTLNIKLSIHDSFTINACEKREREEKGEPNSSKRECPIHNGISEPPKYAQRVFKSMVQ